MSEDNISHEMAQLMDRIVQDTAEVKRQKSETKLLNDALTANKEKLTEMMKLAGTNQITLHNTVIKLTSKKKVKPPTVNEVLGTLEEQLKENETTAPICEELVDEVTKKINEDREETHVEALTFSKAK